MQRKIIVGLELCITALLVFVLVVYGQVLWQRIEPTLFQQEAQSTETNNESTDDKIAVPETLSPEEEKLDVLYYLKNLPETQETNTDTDRVLDKLDTSSTTVAHEAEKQNVLDSLKAME